MNMTTHKTNHLKLFSLPYISSLEDLSRELRVSKRLIFDLTTFQDSFYKTYSIPKKSGGKRTISQPSKHLKAVQAWILHNILYKIRSSDYSKGFDLEDSIAKNAEVHVGNNCIINIDIKDYFGTINLNRVYKLFLKIGYNKEASYILARLCTYKDALPQGAPTSSKLANLISWNLDLRIAGYISKRGFNYSRYADDISISGYIPHSLKKSIPKIFGIIKDEGFEINHKKTRVQDLSGKRSVTGLVLYDETFGIGSNNKRKIRAKLFNFLTKNEFHNEKEKMELDGWHSYLNSVDKRRLRQLTNFAIKLIQNENCLKEFSSKFVIDKTNKSKVDKSK